MDYRKRFVVEPGTKVRIGKIAPAFKDKHQSHDTAKAAIEKHVERMAKLQYLLYADGNQSLLVVLQALDAGGKDGVVRHVFSAMNPQGTWVFGFKKCCCSKSETRGVIAMSHKGFSHIGLSTLDLDKTREFYEGVLGFKPVIADTIKIKEGGRIRHLF
jgi:hypothetical protein